MGHKKVQRIDPLEKALPAGGVDSHAHLDSHEFDQDRETVIRRAGAAGVSQIANVFLSVSDYWQHKRYFDEFPNIFFLLGIHPCDGNLCSLDYMEELASAFASDDRIRAVGEIGLDYHWDDCPREIQLQAFRMQLNLAKRLNKPVVIHCREAEEDCLVCLDSAGFSGYPLLWHCFGGDAALAKRILHHGWHISIPGPITYPANDALREAARIIPADRLLLETDCPYLSPVPWRGTRNEPAYSVFTAHAAAQARGEEAEKLWETCGNNARRFFGLPAW